MGNEELRGREMDSCIEEEYLPLETTRKMGSRKKMKKSKKLRKEKGKSKAKPLLPFDCVHDHHSPLIGDKEKKRRKDKKIKKKKKLVFPDHFAPQSKNVIPPHEVIGKEYTLNSSIQTQEEMNTCKAVKYVNPNICPDKARPKKRVVFDLPPKGSVVKKCLSTQLCPEDGEKQETYAPRLQEVKLFEESQGSSEGIDSQDLFITQNTFISPSLLCPPSASDEDLISVPEHKWTKSQPQPPEDLLATDARRSTAETATQTENFFTSPELSTFLSFRYKTFTSCTEQPVDLSLPDRERGLKTTSILREESDIHQRSKTDLSQLVQTRLNESFFFKTKGEKESPKSQCPLMKLECDHGKKHKK